MVKLYFSVKKICDCNAWTICTWSKHVSSGFILKLGTKGIKAYLPCDYEPIIRKWVENTTKPVLNATGTMTCALHPMKQQQLVEKGHPVISMILADHSSQNPMWLKWLKSTWMMTR
jgi:hypothetical protein